MVKVPRNTATLIGFIAILLWSLLALFTASSGDIPPFQLAAFTFAIGASIGVSRWLFNPSLISTLRQPFQVWALGVMGLFGYHFAYFTALRNAPPVDASLIAYLWPLFIVLFSALLPGEKLKIHHLIGTFLGLSGAVLIVTKGSFINFQKEYIYGYSIAFACALIWSAYSVLSRRFSHISSDVVTGFCLVTALLSLVAHVLLEQTVWPENFLQWLAIVGLGLGPVGLAFYTWDYGVKHGDIQVLGAASYMAPLLSTLILIVAGYAQLTLIVVLACLLITLGAMVAAKDLLMNKKRDSRLAIKR